MRLRKGVKTYNVDTTVSCNSNNGVQRAKITTNDRHNGYSVVRIGTIAGIPFDQEEQDVFALGGGCNKAGLSSKTIMYLVIRVAENQKNQTRETVNSREVCWGR